MSPVLVHALGIRMELALIRGALAAQHPQSLGTVKAVPGLVEVLVLVGFPCQHELWVVNVWYLTKPV